MVQVLIVGKTRMRNGVCLGGLVLQDIQRVRLLPAKGFGHPRDTRYNIGDEWNLTLEEVSKHEINAPHTEDTRIVEQQYIRSYTKRAVRDFVLKRIGAQLVHPRDLFDGRIFITDNKRARVTCRDGVPMYSTGFWRFEKALYKWQNDRKIRYTYCEDDSSCNSDDEDLQLDVPYVGCDEPLEKIPAGTI